MNERVNIMVISFLMCFVVIARETSSVPLIDGTVPKTIYESEGFKVSIQYRSTDDAMVMRIDCDMAAYDRIRNSKIMTDDLVAVVDKTLEEIGKEDAKLAIIFVDTKEPNGFIVDGNDDAMDSISVVLQKGDVEKVIDFTREEYPKIYSNIAESLSGLKENHKLAFITAKSYFDNRRTDKKRRKR